MTANWISLSKNDPSYIMPKINGVSDLTIDNLNEESIARIDFKWIDDINTFCDEDLDISNFTQETKKAVDFLLKFKEKEWLKTNSIEEIKWSLIEKFENSEILEERAVWKLLRLIVINKYLKISTFTDKLTWLCNREYFDKKLEEAIFLSKRNKKPYTIIYFDIDDFKKINDNFWHTVWDNIIKGIAEIMWKNFRVTDTLSRWWWDEFAIILAETNKENAIAKAEQFRKIIETNLAWYIWNAISINSSCKKFLCKNRKICWKTHKLCMKQEITCSMWISSVREYDDIESVIKRADKWLYAAKWEWRNRVNDWEIDCWEKQNSPKCLIKKAKKYIMKIIENKKQER